MHGVLVLAIFGFCLVLAHAVAARRPLPAVFAVIAGAGWPATLYPSQSVAYGALILAAALFVLAGLRTTRPAPGAASPAPCSCSPRRAPRPRRRSRRTACSTGKRWDPNTSRDPVSVRYVWDANYGGVEFPKQKTTVLRVSGPKRGFYWRATTLDQFDADRWLEAPTPLSSSGPSDRAAADRPAAARALAEPARRG